MTKLKDNQRMNNISILNKLDWRLRPSFSASSLNFGREMNSLTTARHVTRAESILGGKFGSKFEDFLHNSEKYKENKNLKTNKDNNNCKRFKNQETERINLGNSADYVKIDWLHSTFPVFCEFDDSLRNPRELEDYIMYCDMLAEYFVDKVLSVAMPQIKRFETEITSGLHGFKRGKKVFALISGEFIQIGGFAYCGESQKRKMFFQLTGKGCGLVQNWQIIKDELEDLQAKITRIDLALDFLNGEFTVDDVITLHNENKFINRGRNPSLDLHGAWQVGGEEGRTVYVGKMKNGKCLCAYEKGKQLGIKDSKWVRYEVRFGNRDRVIPLDVLLNSDEYFKGGYPALGYLLDVLGWELSSKSIPTTNKEAENSLASGLYHLRRCYGKYLNQALLITDCEEKELINSLIRRGIPRKLDPYCVENAYLSFEDLRNSLNERQFYG